MSTPRPTNPILPTQNPNPSYQDLLNVFGWKPKDNCTATLNPNDKCGSATSFDLENNGQPRDTSFQGPNNQSRNCPVASPPPVPKNEESDVSSLIKSAGGDAECIKESDFASDQSGGSVRAGVETLLGSAGFEAKWGQSNIQQKNKQIGCGSLIVKASQIIQKRNLISCIVESCKQDTTVFARANASVTIATTELTPAEQIYKAELLQQQNETNERITNEQSQVIMALYSRPSVTDERIENMQKSFDKINQLRLKAQEAQLKSYSRDIRIDTTTIRVRADVNINAKVELTSDAKSKITQLSEEITKDVAELTVSNTLGVNAMDPSTKNIVNQLSQSESNTISTNITNIEQNTSISADANGNITVSAPGQITLTSTMIDANACVTIVVDQIMKRAVANGVELASKTLNELVSKSAIANDVQGLDDMQNALNDALDKLTKNTMNLGGGMQQYLIIFAVIFGILLLLGGGAFLLFSSFKGGNPSYKFNSGNPTSVLFTMILVFVLIFLLALFFGHGKSKSYESLKNECEKSGMRLCEMGEACIKSKTDFNNNSVRYSAISPLNVEDDQNNQNKKDKQDNQNNQNNQNVWLKYNNVLCDYYQGTPPSIKQIIPMCCPTLPSSLPSSTPSSLPSSTPSFTPSQTPYQTPGSPYVQN